MYAPNIDWTPTGAFGITARGYSIARREQDGRESWSVSNAFGQHLGTYATREQAVRVVR